MTILLYVGDPFGSSAHSAIAHNLIEALDSLGHRLVCVYEIENQFMYELPKSKPNVTYVPLCYEAENVTLRQMINQRRNPFVFVKALFEKVQRKVFDKNRGHKFYGRHLDRECRKHKVDYLICCGNRSRPFDLLYMQYQCPSILLWHELPLVNLGGESMDADLLTKLCGKSIRFGVRQADLNLFVSFADNTYEVEFPLLRTSVHYYAPIALHNKLAFFGKLWVKIREPNLLFDLMRIMPDYVLDIYGGNDDWKEIAPSNVRFLSSVPNDSLQTLAQQYDGLINIENQNTVVKTSKLISYCMLGRPIISFGIRDDLKELVKQYKGVFVVDQVDNLLAQSIRSWLKGCPCCEASLGAPPMLFHTSKYVAERLMEAYNTIKTLP